MNGRVKPSATEVVAERARNGERDIALAVFGKIAPQEIRTGRGRPSASSRMVLSPGRNAPKSDFRFA